MIQWGTTTITHHCLLISAMEVGELEMAAFTSAGSGVSAWFIGCYIISMCKKQQSVNAGFDCITGCTLWKMITRQTADEI